MKRVKPATQMDDEQLMRHLELRHTDHMKMKFTTEPDRDARRLHARDAWVAFHEALHRLAEADGHYHAEREG